VYCLSARSRLGRVIIIIIIFKPTSTKPQAEKLGWLQRKFTLLPWCCGKKPHFLFAEPWKGVGKGMLSLPGVFCDSGDTPANLLCGLNGHLMPCASCFYGKWVEDVCTGQIGVFVYLIIIIIIIIIMRRLTRHVSAIRMTNRRRSVVLVAR